MNELNVILLLIINIIFTLVIVQIAFDMGYRIASKKYQKQVEEIIDEIHQIIEESESDEPHS